MKHKLQNLLKHKLQWLMLLAALLGVSQGVWGTDYYITGAVGTGGWGKWEKMTQSETNIYYYECTSLGEFKFSDNSGYNENFYKQFTNTETVTGVTLNNNCSNNGNCSLSNLQSGYNSPVRVYIDVSTHYIWATATEVPINYYLRGTIPNVGWDNNTAMTNSSGTYTYSVNITASNNTYTFKLYKSTNQWLGNDTSITGTTTITEFFFADSGDKGGGINIRANITGEYTFEFNVSAQTLTVTYPSSCTTPIASNFNIGTSSYSYDGTSKSVSVSAKYGSPTINVYYEGINGTSYSKSTTAPNAAGMYRVTINATAASTYCAVSNLEVATLIIGYQITIRTSSSNVGDLHPDNIYAWITQSSTDYAILGAWPGTALTTSGSNKELTFYVPSTSVKFIINGNNKQTVNITQNPIVDGGVYCCTMDGSKSGDKYNASVAECCTSASINTDVSQTAWETCGTGGSPTQLSFVANGTEPIYQWHKSTTSGFEPSEGTKIDGAIYSTYTPSYPGNPGPVYYKCVATVSCNSSSVTSRQSGGYQWKVVPSVGTISSSNNTPCTGTNFTLTYAPQTTGTYQWKYKSGSTWNNGGTELTYVTSQTGTVQYKMVVTAANGCTAESTGDKIKTIVATPNAALTSVTFDNSSICFGGTSTATANGAVLGGGTGAWSKSGTSVESITNTSASSTVETSEITASSSVSGNTTITYTITGGCGTSPLSESAIITVNPDASLASATISSFPTAICSGSSATASITGAVLGGGTTAWSIDGTGVSINSSNGAITTTAASAGTVPVITYTITDGCGTGEEPISLSASPLTINGVSINRTPSTVHGYEVTTLSASPAKNVTWHIQSKPGGITTNQAYFVKDDGKATASDVSASSIIFKGKGTSGGGNSYTVRATDGTCTTDETFSVINDATESCN